MRNKINVMNRQPDITDEELERFKNFDALLDKHQQLLTEKKPASWKVIVPSVIIIGAIIGYVVINNLTPAENATTASSDSVTLLDKKENVPATSSEPEKEKKESAKREKSVVAKADAERTKSSVEQKTDTAQTKALQSPPPEVQTNPDPISPSKPEMVYVQAEPADGYEVLYAYFAKEIIYPQEAVKDSIQGVLTVTFLINKQGKPEKIKTSGSLGKAFEAEAARLIENMPLWKPATLNGQPVISKLSIPLTFQLQKK